MNEVIEIDVNPTKNKDGFSTRWWSQSDQEMYSHVFRTLEMLEQRQSARTTENVRNAKLYSDLESLGVYSGIETSVRDSNLSNKLTLNVIKSCIDTVTSKIAKTKPRPMFLTDGGDWDLRQRARMLTKYMDGQFDSMGHYAVKQKTFRDSCIFGTGLTKFYIDNIEKCVKSERVIPQEIEIDEAESYSGNPRSMYQRRLVDKDVLCQYFPDDAAFIMEASNMLQGSSALSESARNLVKVVEAWHLPSAKGAGDGKHFIGINNKTLGVAKWEFDFFPFSFERWSDPIMGFFGVGIASELIKIQVQINKILKNIQDGIRLIAIPRVYLDNASEVNLASINNEVGAVIKHNSNMPPVFYTPQAMSADVYRFLWDLVDQAYKVTGVSMLSATSQKPAGLNSGVALREYQDIESDRFQIVSQTREQSFITDAKIVIALQKKLAEDVGEKNIKVRVADKGTMETIKFSDVNMEDDKYMLRIFPTSILPTQPAAKMEKIVEYAQAGWFDKDTAMDLMDFPDIEAANNLIVSPRRVVLKQLDAMINDGKYQPPEPFMNLDLAQSLSQQYYLASKNEGVPEERLELIRRYMEQVVSLKSLAQEGAMAEAMAMQGAASPAIPAVQEAVPTNELIPQQV